MEYFLQDGFFLIITLRNLYFCRFLNSEMSKVLPKNILSSSQLSPIIVPNLMGLTWDLLGTYLGLGIRKITPFYEWFNPECIPNTSRRRIIVTASLKIAAEISYAKLC